MHNVWVLAHQCICSLAVDHFWNGAFGLQKEHGEDGWLKLKPPTTGWHVPIPGVDGAAFVFQPHAKHKALIAVTVLSPPAVGTGQERDNLAT